MVTCPATAYILVLADPFAKLLQALLADGLILPQLAVSNLGNFFPQTDHTRLLAAPDTPLIRHDHSRRCHGFKLQSEHKPNASQPTAIKSASFST
jgi:hypothetical protein